MLGKPDLGRYALTRWDVGGRSPRDALRSQLLDVLEAQRKRDGRGCLVITATHDENGLALRERPFRPFAFAVSIYSSPASK